ncbi:MAG TPA: hypothetical protein ENK56_00765 [Chloroflexi bacterium]|nr:hypothetical protein [Chloroflexota bacterium]
MKVLLAGLADFAWVLYAACGLGAVIYVARALALQRRLGGSLTAFERETMTAQMARQWRVAIAFVVLGGLLFAGQVALLPRVVPAEATPTPTLAAGLVTSTPTPSPTPTPLMGSLPTITATVPPPPPPVPEPTDPPTPTPTPQAGPAPTYPVGARLGNVAELVGYDLAATEVNTGQTVGLTLYWRALEGANTLNYWVFTHLLPPEFDRLIGQHDGVPAGGTRPTTGWTPGEVIVDHHELIFYEADYTGPAQIAVGLYDPGSMARVPVEGGGDYILLPTVLNIVAP